MTPPLNLNLIAIILPIYYKLVLQSSQKLEKFYIYLKAKKFEKFLRQAFFIVSNNNASLVNNLINKIYIPVIIV